MAKPTEIPSWATDAGATNDPGASRKATGFVTGKKAPAKWFNWLHNRSGQWFSYLSNLHSEPEFLDKPYAWTGEHAFNGGVDSIAITHASNTYDYSPARLAVPKFVLMSSFIPIGAVLPIYRTTGAYWEFQDATSTLLTEIDLPTGATLEAVDAYVTGAVGGGYNMKLAVRRIIRSTTGPNSLDTAVEDAAVTDPDTLTCNVIAAVNNAASAIQISLTSSATSDAGQYGRVHSVRLRFTDPGPRNH
jgi:hypothetical protein